MPEMSPNEIWVNEMERGWRASQVALVVKNLLAKAGDARDMGSIPELGRSSGVGNGNPVFLPGKTPWTEEPGRLQFMGSPRVGHD